MNPSVASIFSMKTTWFEFCCWCCDLVLIEEYRSVSSEKLIVCITQTGPSLPYHCYWGESTPRLPPSPPLSSITAGTRGSASKESSCVTGNAFNATHTDTYTPMNLFSCSCRHIYLFCFLCYFSCNGNHLCWQSFSCWCCHPACFFFLLLSTFR